MKPRRTVASNHVLSLEGGNEDNDLWCSVKQGDGATTVASTWELSAEEREKIAAGENVELVVFGSAHPPVLLRVTNVPIGGHISREEIVDRLRGMGNDPLADLFAEKSIPEIEVEIQSWDLPEDLRAEMLAFVKLLEVDEPAPPSTDEWPFDDDPPDPL